MWYLPETNDVVHNENDVCEKGVVMYSLLQENPKESIPKKCCIGGDYWKQKKAKLKLKIGV